VTLPEQPGVEARREALCPLADAQDHLQVELELSLAELVVQAEERPFQSEPPEASEVSDHDDGQGQVEADEGVEVEDQEGEAQ